VIAVAEAGESVETFVFEEKGRWVVEIAVVSATASTTSPPRPEPRSRPG